MCHYILVLHYIANEIVTLLCSRLSLNRLGCNSLAQPSSCTAAVFGRILAILGVCGFITRSCFAGIRVAINLDLSRTSVDGSKPAVLNVSDI